MRKPADFAAQPIGPFQATFHSLMAIPRSDLAPWHWPEVRKGDKSDQYRSNLYALTNQTVGLRNCLLRGDNARNGHVRIPFDMALCAYLSRARSSGIHGHQGLHMTDGDKKLICAGTSRQGSRNP